MRCLEPEQLLIIRQNRCVWFLWLRKRDLVKTLWKVVWLTPVTFHTVVVAPSVVVNTQSYSLNCVLSHIVSTSHIFPHVLFRLSTGSANEWVAKKSLCCFTLTSNCCTCLPLWSRHMEIAPNSSLSHFLFRIPTSSHWWTCNSCFSCFSFFCTI